MRIQFFEKDERARAAKFAAFEAQAVPKVFSALEAMVKGAFFGGEGPSYADVHLFDVVRNSVTFSLPHFSMAAYPKLQAIMAQVEADAHIVAFLAAKQH